MNLVLLIIFVIQTIIGIALGTLFGDSISDYVSIFFAQIVPIFIPAMIYCFASKNGFEEYERSKKFTFLNVIFCIISSMCANILISYFSTYIWMPIYTFFSQNTQSQNVILPKNAFEFLVDIIFICLMPAIFEEILFRGVVLTKYEKIYGSKKAIVMCGIVFALMHNNVGSLVPQFLVGIFLSYIVFKFNSIYMGMIAHFTNNCVTLIIQLAVSNKWSGLKTVILSKPLLTSIILILIFTFSIVMIMHLNTENKFKKREYRWSQVKKERKNFKLIIITYIIMQIIFAVMKLI